MEIKKIKKELNDIIKYTKRRDDYAADRVPVELLEAVLDLILKQETQINDYKQRCESAEERYATLTQSAAESSEKKTKSAKTDMLNELNRRITAIPYQLDINEVQKEIKKFIKEIEK